MAATLERQEDCWLIRLEGEATFANAAELKDILMPWTAAGVRLEWNLSQATEVDLAILQLIWASTREAALSGLEIAGCASRAAWKTIEESGFADLPGFPFERLAID
jgi:anti-anti-sigma regulatory factor